MKAKNVFSYRSVGVMRCTGAILLMATGALGQNLFVSNYSTDDIYEITPAGVQSVFASGMNYPFGIAFNGAGDLFVANSADNAGAGYISEIAPSGAQSTFASGVDPVALAFNNAGDLFEADYRSGNIYEYTPSGMQSTFASGFSFPLSLAFNNAGDLFVGSGYGSGNGIISEITPSGKQSTFASGLNFPQALTFNSAGDLFVADESATAVYEFSPTGMQSAYASVNSPQGLAFDSAGDLFVSTATGPIIEVKPNGAESTFASESGIPELLAFQPVPEPPASGLIGVGAVALLAFRCRRKAIAQELNRVQMVGAGVAAFARRI